VSPGRELGLGWAKHGTTAERRRGTHLREDRRLRVIEDALRGNGWRAALHKIEGVPRGRTRSGGVPATATSVAALSCRSG